MNFFPFFMELHKSMDRFYRLLASHPREPKGWVLELLALLTLYELHKMLVIE
uniref:Uncharacterized protein n=1 Tax=Oryza brachyantha TaxID=4533 RepID=J3LCM2_ORYBR